ncbi:MAG: UDP-N-acetylmuramoyl-L-alanine--D-glutamate ligase [Burkholderiaceae bacterium]|jgi:UDP-N-acetylmuramoylalanine--D-glutamate ligase|nr:UDP-N-acetylmuramoyl-L-alanine--D-glutamate ligase [Burkholderiaceae bacterium]
MTQRALVLGLGDSGLAIARWLARAGWAVRVADTREVPPRLEALRAQLPAAEFIGGEFAETLLADVALVAMSPGLSPTRSAAAPLLQAARRAGLDVVGEIELFARELARLRAATGYAPKVIGVTGTNGKTTTTRLTGLLVERCGRNVAVAGNIAPAALDVLAERLDAGVLPDVWVLELSSFQLETTTSLACDAATVLNITQDHLDWHGTMAAYVQAKERIFAAGTVRVLNRDDATVAALTGKRARVVTFGAEAPAQPEAFGLVRDAGISWLAWAEDTSLPARRRKAGAATVETAPEVHVHRLMPVDALQIRGRHNALNALAALALARAIGLPLAPMLHALREYRGEPHRVELVASVAGVEYYDDSKGTNVGATAAALDGLGAEGRRLVVILGGDGKGQDFTPLAAPVARHARAVVLIGRDAPAIRSALGATGVALIDAGSLPQAVERATREAQAGDAVLLSPACASFDMFRDYRHRAEVYVDAVRELAAEAGQPC